MCASGQDPVSKRKGKSLCGKQAGGTTIRSHSLGDLVVLVAVVVIFGHDARERVQER